MDMHGKRVLVVGIGNSAVDITSELSRKGVAEAVFISTRSGAWVMPKYLFGKPVGDIVKTSPHLPLRLQRWLARPIPYIASGRMEDFGLPHPNHNFLEAHPTVSSELLLRLGQGDAVAKPNVSELLGDSVRFEDGSTEEVDVIVYATGYKISFPFFDDDFLSAPDNRLPLYKRDLQARHRRPGADRVRAGDPHAVPLRRAAEQAGGRVRGRRLRPAPGGRDGAGDSVRRGALRRATSPIVPATRCRWTGTSTSTRCARRRCRRDASAPGAGWRPALAGRAERGEPVTA